LFIDITEVKKGDTQMKQKLPMIARYLLGLIFFVFGGAGLLNLLPPPPDMPEKLMTFMNGLMATGYFFPLLKGTETLCGLLLITGFAPALALVILAPISINIFMLHAFVTPGLNNLVLPLTIAILHIVAAKGYWHIYKPLFNRKH
jgi:uncharacterized membrane protein YphA (DoxX/SURF4 family)